MAPFRWLFFVFLSREADKPTSREYASHAWKNTSLRRCRLNACVRGITSARYENLRCCIPVTKAQTDTRYRDVRRCFRSVFLLLLPKCFSSVQETRIRSQRTFPAYTRSSLIEICNASSIDFARKRVHARIHTYKRTRTQSESESKREREKERERKRKRESEREAEKEKKPTFLSRIRSRHLSDSVANATRNQTNLSLLPVTLRPFRFLVYCPPFVFAAPSFLSCYVVSMHAIRTNESRYSSLSSLRYRRVDTDSVSAIGSSFEAKRFDERAVSSIRSRRRRRVSELVVQGA